MEILARGGSALDAVEAGLRRCEDNLDDHYVGTGGLPNAQGVVELDASLMVGSTRAFGAVGAVKGLPATRSRSPGPYWNACRSTACSSAREPSCSPRRTVSPGRSS